MKNNNCYLYVYTDPLKPGKFTYTDIGISFLYEPFYVGKGSRQRMLQHIPEAKRINKTYKHKTIINIIDSGLDPKDYIVKIKNNLSDDEAYLLEEQVVDSIGRKRINKGPLLNIRPGGGWMTYNGNSKLSYKDKLDIKELYRSGMSPMEIKDIYSVCYITVLVALREVNAEIVQIYDKVRVFDKESSRQVADLYAYGFSSPEIAEIYNTCEEVVLKAVKANNVEIRAGRSFTKLRTLKDEIISKYNSGASFEELEEFFSTASIFIGKILRENGVQVNPPNFTKTLETKVIKLYQSGKTMKQTGLEVGLSICHVENILKINNIKTRGRSAAVKK